MSESEPVDHHELLPPPSPPAARKETPSIISIVPEKQNATELPEVSQLVKGTGSTNMIKGIVVYKFAI